MKTSFRSAACALLLWAIAPLAGAADPPPVYGVLSLIGDGMSIVSRASTTGSRIDRNQVQSVPVNDRSLDTIALVATHGALREARPQAEPVLLVANDRSFYALQEGVFGDEPGAAAARQAMQKMLRDAKANRLLLITKYRGEVTVKLAHQSTGNGRIAGIGFYMEAMDMHLVESGESGSGYLAPFAYLRVSLVDVDTMKVLREATATESESVMLKRSAASSNLWDALDGKEKAAALQQVIEASLSKAVPAVLN